MNTQTPAGAAQDQTTTEAAEAVFGIIPVLRFGPAEVQFTVSGCWLTTPFDKNFTKELKATIPAKVGVIVCRIWHPETKKWWIYRAYRDDLLILLADYYQVSVPEALVLSGST